MAQQMPLPLTISCSSKSRLVLPSWCLPFWCLLTRVVPDKFQKSSKTVVCVLYMSLVSLIKFNICVLKMPFCPNHPSIHPSLRERSNSLVYVMIAYDVLSSTSAWQLYDGSIELMTDDKQGALYL